MTKNMLKPQDHVFWYLKKSQMPRQVSGSLKTDVAIVGGGVAGLSAAHSFRNKGYNVVLLEKYFCGSGASGKSSGFITPDSELNLSYFKNKFGANEAKKLWEFVCSGVALMRTHIQNYSINCDYISEDSLVVATSPDAYKELEREHRARKQLGYESTLYPPQALQTILGSSHYFGGMRSDHTFGINAYAYCQGMKEQLEKDGVDVFEETPVLQINKHDVETPGGIINADTIIVCVDRFLPELQPTFSPDVFHAQTFLMISAPLPPDIVKKIFPEQRLMVWDTDFLYQYYRISGDNRFMIGGSDLLSIFWGHEQHNNTRIFEKLSAYVKEKFPYVPITFEYMWPGLIGISKDIMPLAGHDKNNPHIYYISAATGLPWAAALGAYSAEHIVDGRNDLDGYFTPDRKFLVGGWLQKILGKRISFALSNVMTMR